VHAEALQVLGGQVNPPVGQVLGHVLPVLGQLQGGADVIGERDAFRGGDAEDVEHDLAHGLADSSQYLPARRRCW
jgi:hypothetical protein